jgi:hypothetical protein
VLFIKQKDHFAKIYMRQGKIYYCSIDDNHDLGPQKSFYRLVRWEEGDFELQPPDNQDFMVEMEGPHRHLLLEGLRQLDELRRIEKDLPKGDAALELPVPLTVPLRDLSPTSSHPAGHLLRGLDVYRDGQGHRQRPGDGHRHRRLIKKGYVKAR